MIETIEVTKIVNQLRAQLERKYPDSEFKVSYNNHKTYSSLHWVTVSKVRKRKFWFAKRIRLVHIDWTGEVYFYLKNKGFRKLANDVMDKFPTGYTIRYKSHAALMKKLAAKAPPPTDFNVMDQFGPDLLPEPKEEEDETFTIDGAL